MCWSSALFVTCQFDELGRVALPRRQQSRPSPSWESSFQRNLTEKQCATSSVRSGAHCLGDSQPPWCSCCWCHEGQESQLPSLVAFLLVRFLFLRIMASWDKVLETTKVNKMTKTFEEDEVSKASKAFEPLPETGSSAMGGDFST